MNWRFWERTNGPSNGNGQHKEEDGMGIYMRREETPEQRMMDTLQFLDNAEQVQQQQVPEPEPEAPPDPLAGLSPEQQAALNERLEYDRYQTRAALAQVGIDMTPSGRPAIVDPQRASQWMGVPAQQPQNAMAPPEAQQYAPPPQPLAEPDDAPIPDPNYSPAEFRQWMARNTGSAITAAVREAIAPLVQQFQSTHQATVEMRINSAMGTVAQDIDQYAPWLAQVAEHPDFEPYYRQALSQIDPAKWQTPQDRAAVAGMVSSYLKPYASPQAPPAWGQQQPAPQPTWQEQYAQAGYPQRQYAGQPSQAGPRQPPPPQPQQPTQRNERGQFIGRGANAAVSRAAAQSVAPSQPAGRAPLQQQYDQFILEAAARQGISAEEARLVMQDNDGEASREMRLKRLRG